jgi:hypothetical protein
MSDEPRGGDFQTGVTNEDWRFTDERGDGIIDG